MLAASRRSRAPTARGRAARRPRFVLSRVPLLLLAPLAVAFPARAAAPAAGSPPGVFDLLQPGSRASLGLGGDPFLSPLDDEVGWWSEVRPRGVGRAWIEASAGEPVALGDGAEEGVVGHNEFSWGVAGEGRLAGRRWVALGRLWRPQWATAWNASSGLVRVDGSRSRFELGVRAPRVAWGITAQATAPVWSAEGAAFPEGARAGLRLEAGGRLAVQGEWGGGPLPGGLRSTLYGAEWAAALNCRVTPARADVRARLLPWLAIEGTRLRTRYDPVAPRTDEFVYQIAPSGSSARDEAGVVVGRGAPWRGLFRWTEIRAELAGEASWGGQRFGLLNYARGSLTSRLVALELRGARGARAILESEWVHGSATGRARFETWPFTSTVVDLLGPRRIYKGELSARWWRAHAAVGAPLGSRADGRLGLTWYEISPRGTLLSWSPAFLTFGQTNLSRADLGVESVRLLAVSLGFGRRVGSLEAGIQIEQLVRAWLERDEIGAGPGGPGSPGSEEEPPGEPLSWTWPPGGQVQVTLSREF